MNRDRSRSPLDHRRSRLMLDERSERKSTSQNNDTRSSSSHGKKYRVRPVAGSRAHDKHNNSSSRHYQNQSRGGRQCPLLESQANRQRRGLTERYRNGLNDRSDTQSNYRRLKDSSEVHSGLVEDNSLANVESPTCSIAVDYNHGVNQTSNYPSAAPHTSRLERDGPTEAKPVSHPDPVIAASEDQIENDEETLMRRQKNLDYMKGCEAYDKYITILPKERRRKRDPQTPDKFVKVSRRMWDGQIKHWKLRIHRYLDEHAAS